METWPKDAPVFTDSEMITRDQESAAWKDARLHRITSTNVKNICTSTNYSQTAKTILNPPDLSFNVFVNKGKQDEEKGVQYLLNELRGKGFEANAFLIGFVTHSKYNWLGASPDRLFKVNDEFYLVEIKNWYVTEKQKNKKDLKYLDNSGKLRRGHSHYYQIQTALLVSGLKRCYFVVHGSECSIEIVEYDDIFCNTMLEKLIHFYENHFKTCIPSAIRA